MPMFAKKIVITHGVKVITDATETEPVANTANVHTSNTTTTIPVNQDEPEETWGNYASFC